MPTIQGRVIREQSGAALPGATLKLVQTDDGTVLLRTQTDGAGAFSGDIAAPAGPLRIDLRHPEGVASAPFDPDSAEAVAVALHGPQLRIAGRLLYDGVSAGLPVAGASVSLTDTNPDGSRDEIFSAETDGEGRFSGLSADWWDTVARERWSFQDARVEVEEVRSEEDELDLTLTVSHNGHTLLLPFPFAGDDVEIVVSVPVTIQEHARRPAPPPPPAPAPAPAPDPDRFRLLVSARVRDQSGAPVSGAQVTLLETDPDGTQSAILSAETDAEGRFSGRSAPWKEASAELEGLEADGVLLDGDLLTLHLRVERGGRSATVPFYFVADGFSVEVKVPWPG